MKRFLPPVLIITIIAGSAYFVSHYDEVTARLVPDSARTPESIIRASGIVEAEDVHIAAEIGGRVVDVFANEGDSVEAGDILIRMDTAVVDDQIAQARAALRAAQANLEAALNPVRQEEIEIARARLDRARASRDGAVRAVDHAVNMRDAPLELNAQINEARSQAQIAAKQVEAAQAQLTQAEAGRDRYQFSASDQDKTQYQVFLRQVEAAQAAISSAIATQQGMERQFQDLLAIRENPVHLNANVNAARVQLEIAEQAVALAQADVAVLEAGPQKEDTDIARAQVALAEAMLEEIQVQRAKLTLYSPISGVVSTRAIEPGEIAIPGRTLLAINDMERVSVTVFVPESAIGPVKLGLAADVYVDTFTGRAFGGVVSFIAPEAAFTPKNVQTRSERVNMAFAVRVDLPNASHGLKPGVPADAHIHLDKPAAPEIVAALASGQVAATPPMPLPPPSPRPTPTPMPRETPGKKGPPARDTAASTAPQEDTPGPVEPRTPATLTPPAPTPAPIQAAQPPGRIVFAVQDETGHYGLWVSATDGTGRKLVGTDMHQPDARQDGMVVANGTGAGSMESLVTLRLDGSDLKEASRYSNDLSPKWAPDGTRLLYVNEQVGELVVQDSDQEGARRLPVYFDITPLLGKRPAWLNDGQIVYQGCDVWRGGSLCGLYGAQVGGGTAPWRLVDDTQATAPAAYRGRIAYMSDARGDWDVFLLDEELSGPLQITEHPAADGIPAWSPDGEWLAFLSDRDGVWAVWAVRPRDGQEPARLFELGGSPGTDWTQAQIGWVE